MSDYLNLVWQTLTSMPQGLAVNLIIGSLAGLAGSAAILALMNAGR